MGNVTSVVGEATMRQIVGTRKKTPTNAQKDITIGRGTTTATMRRLASRSSWRPLKTSVQLRVPGIQRRVQL